MPTRETNETTKTADAAIRPGETIYARLIGRCNDKGGYPWREVVDAPGGAWEPTGRAGSAATDPAFEITGMEGLGRGDRVYLMRRGARTGEWRFVAGGGFAR